MLACLPRSKTPEYRAWAAAPTPQDPCVSRILASKAAARRHGAINSHTQSPATHPNMCPHCFLTYSRQQQCWPSGLDEPHALLCQSRTPWPAHRRWGSLVVASRDAVRTKPGRLTGGGRAHAWQANGQPGMAQCKTGRKNLLPQAGVRNGAHCGGLACLPRAGGNLPRCRRGHLEQVPLPVLGV